MSYPGYTDSMRSAEDGTFRWARVLYFSASAFASGFRGNHGCVVCFCILVETKCFHKDQNV